MPAERLETPNELHASQPDNYLVAWLTSFALTILFPSIFPATAHAQSCTSSAVVVTSTSPLAQQLCTNLGNNLAGPFPGYTRLVISFGSRVTTDAYDAVAQAANTAGISSTTAVIGMDWNEDNSASKTLLDWSQSDFGLDDISSINQATSTGQLFPGVTQFPVIDDIVRLAANPSIFPDLEQITISGFSVGGQLSNRYAVVNKIQNTIAASGRPIEFRYVVGAPSSHVYLNGTHWDAIHNILYVPAAASVCANFDANDFGLFYGNYGGRGYGSWPYGTLNSHSIFSLGFPPDIPARLGLPSTDYISRYLHRTVTYLVGDADNTTTSSSLDQTCPAELGGVSRIDRSQGYAHYALALSGENDIAVADVTHHGFIVAGAGHAANLLYNSVYGLYGLFGIANAKIVVSVSTISGLAPNAWQYTLSTTTNGCTIPANTANPVSTVDGSGGSISFDSLPVISSVHPTSQCKYDVTQTPQQGWTVVEKSSSGLKGVTLKPATAPEVNSAMTSSTTSALGSITTLTISNTQSIFFDGFELP